MSSKSPENSQPPQRGKESWRLRGVHRAEPHLDENERTPWLAWAAFGGVIVLLAIVVALFLLRPGSSTPVPVAAPTLPFPSATPFPVPTSPSSTPGPTATLPPPSASPTAGATATPTTAKPTAVLAKYRVRIGDTLSSIAARYHVSMRAIMEANGMKNEIVHLGDELIIPLPTPHP